MDSDETERRRQLIASLERFRDAEALYREGSRFCRVRVGGVEASDDVLAARLELIPTAGLDDSFPSSWTISTSWERIREADDLWVLPYVGVKLNFEPGLLASIVRRSEAVRCESYDRQRFEQIVEWIEAYRKSQLARQLVGPLKLIWNDRLIGTVNEHFVADYLEVHGKFTIAADVDQELRIALGRYQRWWEESWGKDAPEPAPKASLEGEWRLETADGRRFGCRIPVVSFSHGTVILYSRSWQPLEP